MEPWIAGNLADFVLRGGGRSGRRFRSRANVIGTLRRRIEMAGDSGCCGCYGCNTGDVSSCHGAGCGELACYPARPELQQWPIS